MLSGGECTLNTLAGKNDIKITKGKLGTYDYQGDSGTFLYTLVAYFRLPLLHSPPLTYNRHLLSYQIHRSPCHNPHPLPNPKLNLIELQQETPSTATTAPIALRMCTTTKPSWAIRLSFGRRCWRAGRSSKSRRRSLGRIGWVGSLSLRRRSRARRSRWMRWEGCGGEDVRKGEGKERVGCTSQLLHASVPFAG